MVKETDAVDPRDPRVMTGQIWEELCDTFRRAGELVAGPDVPDTPLDRAVGYRYLTQFIEAGINFCVAHGDGDYPEFTRMMDMGMRWGLDSPDCLYIVATVKEGREYRIWGDPGTSNHMDIQLNTGHYALGDISAVRTLGSISRDDFVRGPDGGFEIFLGGRGVLRIGCPPVPRRASSWFDRIFSIGRPNVLGVFKSREWVRPLRSPTFALTRSPNGSMFFGVGSRRAARCGKP